MNPLAFRPAFTTVVVITVAPVVTAIINIVITAPFITTPLSAHPPFTPARIMVRMGIVSRWRARIFELESTDLCIILACTLRWGNT